MVTNTMLKVFQAYKKDGGKKDAGDVTIGDIMAVRAGLVETEDDLGNTEYIGTDQDWRNYEENKSYHDNQLK